MANEIVGRAGAPVPPWKPRIWSYDGVSCGPEGQASYLKVSHDVSVSTVRGGGFVEVHQLSILYLLLLQL